MAEFFDTGGALTPGGTAMFSPWRPVTYANGGILSVKAVADNTAAATLKRQRH
ncbi:MULTISPECIES: hypothetical protein [unclassified Mesorhizobium]|uniref:hypothetical protein n=1 Tax=unclassified Mesorhizobium TaxID=325217 RepID=UPI003335D4FC